MAEIDVTFSFDAFAQRVGGVSRYFSQLVHHLPEFDVRPHAAGGFHDNEYLRNAPPSSVRGVVLPIPWKRGAPVIHARLNSLTRRWWEPRSGIYHPTYYTARPLHRSLPTVVTIYDMIHERCREYFPPTDRTREQKAAWAGRADRIIAISHSTKTDLVEILRLDPDKITVIHPGIENVNAPPSGWPRREPDLVLYVGHRGMYKNWISLVRAMSSPELRSHRLVCFGGGEMTASEARALRDAGVLERTRFVSGSDFDLAGWYRRASVLVYTSLYEGYGYPPLEATSHECPVVCGNTSSLLEMMSGIAVMVDDVTDPKSLAEAASTAMSGQVPKGIVLPSPRDSARQHAHTYRSLE